MPRVDTVLPLVTRALEGIPVTVRVERDSGRSVICIDLGPSSETSSEASPTATSGFTYVESVPESSTPASLPVPASWWLHPEPLVPGPAVLALASQLRASGSPSPVDRIRAAYQRGRQGAAILRGVDTHFSGPRSQLQNRCYVVFRARGHSEPFFTWNLGTHQAAVRPPPGDFDRAAVSHGFASQVEARAFCLGAGLPDLAPLRQ